MGVFLSDSLNDGDGVCGDVDDTPDVPNADQSDSDNDGVGDVVDMCIGNDSVGDSDSDCFCDDVDALSNNAAESADAADKGKKR